MKWAKQEERSKDMQGDFAPFFGCKAFAPCKPHRLA
jgi:hypothetical protein